MNSFRRLESHNSALDEAGEHTSANQIWIKHLGGQRDNGGLGGGVGGMSVYIHVVPRIPTLVVVMLAWECKEINCKDIIHVVEYHNSIPFVCMLCFDEGHTRHHQIY